MTDLNCQLSDEAGGGAADTISGLTVGQVFQMSCQGELASFDPAALSVFVMREGNPKPDIYSMKILSTLEFQPTQAKFLVTSYQIGSLPQGEIHLTDGKVQAKISGPQWTVKSVIEAKEGEEVKAFGPIPALQGTLGNVIWIFLAAAVVAWIGNLIWEIRERKRLKKLFESLKSMRTHRSALDEFYTEIRALDRKYNFANPSEREVVGALFRSFRMYLVRELSVPAHEWNARKVIAEIRRRSTTPPPELIGELKKCWVELDHSRQLSTKIDSQSLQQTVALTRTTTEKIAGWVGASRGDVKE